MIKIDYLNRAGEMLLGQIPDPLRPFAHDDFLLRPAPAALPGFHIESFAKLLGGFDGAGVGGGIRIADGEALLIPRGLCEYAFQFGFSRMSRLVVRFALP